MIAEESADENQSVDTTNTVPMDIDEGLVCLDDEGKPQKKSVYLQKATSISKSSQSQIRVEKRQNSLKSISPEKTVSTTSEDTAAAGATPVKHGIFDGGAVAAKMADSVTHVVSEVPVRRACQILKINDLPHGRLLDVKEYKPYEPVEVSDRRSSSPIHKIPLETAVHRVGQSTPPKPSESAAVEPVKDAKRPHNNGWGWTRGKRRKTKKKNSSATDEELTENSDSDGSNNRQTISFEKTGSQYSDKGTDDEGDSGDGGVFSAWEAKAAAYAGTDVGSDADSMGSVSEKSDTDDEGTDDEDPSVKQARKINKALLGKKLRTQDAYLCMKKNAKAGLEENNKNKHITDLLQLLLDRYQDQNDHWRILAYRKAIRQIKECKRRITSGQEAAEMFSIGKKIAVKIDEIIRTGRLKKAENEPEEISTLRLFQKIHGVGKTTAERWYAKGYRTLDDLQQHAQLTKDQTLGLLYYDDLNEKMPRSEAKAIGAVVEEACQAVVPGLECHIMGSYRRGADFCGDVDVIVTHPDGVSQDGVLPQILEILRKKDGFLVADLTDGFSHSGTPLYKGICKLPESDKHRRLDILMVPYEELGAACMSLSFTLAFRV
ncbi:hypothetical protein HK102_006616 [Quaeritorhiza haematococci]|nr:hypothetical protein HK102_006616 [Quaeritorhiza haematococci]